MNIFDVYPLFDIALEKAEGMYVYDEKGNKYLDLYGGHAVISIGHTHPHYVEKLSKQLHKIGFYSNSVKIPLQNELAEKLGRLSGCYDYALFLCNSGAEANENALKMASFKNNRRKIIAISGAFHGRTSLTVAATDNISIQAKINQDHEIVFVKMNDFYELRNALDNSVCAVIVEGIQGVGGVFIPSTEFLQEIRSLCNSTGAVFIADEIQSGFGRSGKFFAHQHAGVKPDIITMAKGMGNGFPIAGILLSPDFEAKHGLLGTTFGGNYLACAASIAVLDVIESENLLKNATTVGDYLMTQLRNLTGIKEVRGMGLMIGIEFLENSAPIRNSLLNDYKIFTGSSSNKNTLRILPPLNISKNEADYFLESLQTVLTQYV